VNLFPKHRCHHGRFVLFFPKTRPFRIELSFRGTSIKDRASSTVSGIPCIGSPLRDKFPTWQGECGYVAFETHFPPSSG